MYNWQLMKWCINHPYWCN